jgi:hypothetical protein
VALYPQKLALTSPTSGGRSVGIVCSWTEAMEFSFYRLCITNNNINNSIQFFVIYMLSQQLQGQLLTQHSVDLIIIIIIITIIIIIIMGKVKTPPFNYNVLTMMMIIIIIICQDNLLPISPL